MWINCCLIIMIYYVKLNSKIELLGLTSGFILRILCLALPPPELI